MTDETKEAISLNLELLKMTLQETGSCLGLLYNKEEPQKSQIIIVDKENFVKGKVDGIKIDLEQMNGFAEQARPRREEVEVRVTELKVQNFKDIMPGEAFLTPYTTKKKYFVATDYEENGERGVVDLETGEFHMFKLNDEFKVVNALLNVISD